MVCPLDGERLSSGGTLARVTPGRTHANDERNNEDNLMNSRLDATRNGKPKSSKPYTVAGAGEIVTSVWEIDDPDELVAFRFNVFHMDAESGEVVQQFGIADIPYFALLAQALATLFSIDERLPQELRDDLGCLAHCLDEALGEDVELKSAQPKH